MTPRTIGRIAFAAAAVAALVGTQSCRKPEAESCPTGIFCPAGWHCAAKTAECIKGLCGNGNVDPGEKCDDGGTTPGDLIDGKHCSKDCQSDETCKNGTIDTAVGEVCDPDPWDPTACSDDCKSSLVCGNNQIDLPKEECDPGSDNVPLETFDCDLDCTKRTCGDGTVNRAAPAEQCDRNGDGVAGADGQSATCNSDCTSSRCGDGKKNPLATAPVGGEQCDDGDRNGWEANCLFGCIKNECGDDHINRTQVGGKQIEDCDPGDANPRVNCAYGPDHCTLCSVCKFVDGTPHFCGDGTPDLADNREKCDLGRRNGLPVSECIYGNQICDRCSTDCQSSTSVTGPFCGDDSVNGGRLTFNGDWYNEDCDDARSFVCGTCSRATADKPCHWVDKKEAHGKITVLTTEGLEGVRFALSGDSTHTATVFEYVAAKGTVAAPIVEIVIGTDEGATATNTANAISGKGIGINVAPSGNAVTLTNQRMGVLGNLVIEVSVDDGVDPTPDTSALTLEDMTGGIGCRTGQPCRYNNDCVNGNCNNRTCN